MGGIQSYSCKNPMYNPDVLDVVTLSDSAVQRLPIVVDDNPLLKEQRNQNIDDFWRDRLECLENTFLEYKGLTDWEFQRLEQAIKKMAPGKGALNCPRQVEDITTCYTLYKNESLKCSPNVKRLELCLDTMMRETAKKKHKDLIRSQKKHC